MTLKPRLVSDVEKSPYEVKILASVVKDIETFDEAWQTAQDMESMSKMINLENFVIKIVDKDGLVISELHNDLGEM